MVQSRLFNFLQLFSTMSRICCLEKYVLSGSSGKIFLNYTDTLTHYNLPRAIKFRIHFRELRSCWDPLVRRISEAVSCFVTQGKIVWKFPPSCMKWFLQYFLLLMATLVSLQVGNLLCKRKSVFCKTFRSVFQIV